MSIMDKMPFRHPVQIIRPSAGHWEEATGSWVEGSDSEELTIIAGVQPASSADYDQMQSLLEGRRIEAMVRIYTGAVLNVAGKDWNNGDVLVWPQGQQGRNYRVIARSPWQSGLLNHYRYHAVLELEP